MTTARITATAIIAATSVTALYGAALAQTGTGRTPTQSDFDACNREAQVTRGGSASPSTAPGASTSSGLSTSPRGGASGSGSSTGSVSGGVASGTTSAAGATGATGTLSGGSTLSSGPSATGEALRGIASAGAGDPAFQQAYRDCMRRRGL